MVRPPSRDEVLIPFSLCKLPTGMTMLEFVTSGRSVAISSLGCGQLSPYARAPVAANASKAVKVSAHAPRPIPNPMQPITPTDNYDHYPPPCLTPSPGH